MTAIIRSVLLATALGLPVSPVTAQQSDSAAAVAVVEAYHSALAAGDTGRAVALLAEDAAIIESGTVESRADYLAHHFAADMKAAQGSKGVRTLDRVTLAGDVAWVISRTLTPPAATPGSTGSEMAELMVMSRTTAGWKIRAIHWSSRRRRP